MSTAVALRPVYAKEIRALLPLLAGCGLAMAIAVVPGPLEAMRAGIALVAYVFGAVALGAVSIGHGSTGRTLSMYLAAPWSRQALFQVKALVLTACLVIHASAAGLVSTVGSTPSAFSAGSLSAEIAGLWYLPLAMALCIAPALTMLFRGVLAGVVFTIAIPMSLWLAFMFATAWSVGATEASRDAQMLALLDILWRSVLVAVVACAPLTWHLFRRLEAMTTPLGASIGRDAGDLLTRYLPSTFQRGTPGGASAGVRRPRRPVRALVLKELRLQQVSFAMAGLFASLCLAVAALSLEAPVRHSILQASTLLYLGLISVMIGALTSAEEREFGVLEAEYLNPVPIWQATVIKMATAFGLLLTLGIGVVVVLGAYGGYDVPLTFNRGNLNLGRKGSLLEILGLLMFGSAFVSSFTRGGLKAILRSMPLLAIAATMFVTTQWAARSLIWNSLGLSAITRDVWFLRQRPRWTLEEMNFISTIDQAAWWVALIVISATLLALIHRNHRVALVDSNRVRTQILWLVVSGAVAASLSGGTWAVALWLLSDR